MSDENSGCLVSLLVSLLSPSLAESEPYPSLRLNWSEASATPGEGCYPFLFVLDHISGQIIQDLDLRTGAPLEPDVPLPDSIQ